MADDLPDGYSEAPNGIIEAGNIDLSNRPKVQNPDGRISTVYSMNFGTDKGEVLVPRVSDDGRILSVEEARDQYFKTGKHLGIFKTRQDAEAYAESLHEQQAKAYSNTPSGDIPEGYSEIPNKQVSTSDLIIPAIKEIAKTVGGGAIDTAIKGTTGLANALPTAIEGALRIPEAVSGYGSNVAQDLMANLAGQRVPFQSVGEQAIKTGRGILGSLSSPAPEISPAFEGLPVQTSGTGESPTMGQGFKQEYSKPVSPEAAGLAATPMFMGAGAIGEKAISELGTAFGNLFKPKQMADAKKIYTFDQNAEMVKALEEKIPVYDQAISKVSSEKNAMLGAMEQFQHDPYDTRYTDTAKTYQDRIDALNQQKNDIQANIFKINGLDNFAKDQQHWWNNFSPAKKLFDIWLTNGKSSLESIAPSGKKMSDLVTMMQYQNGNNQIVYGRMVNDILGDIGSSKSPEEWSRFRQLYEAGKLTTREDQIIGQKLDSLAKQFMIEGNKFGVLLNDITGAPAGLDRYFPHQLSDEATNLLFTNPKEFYSQVIEKNKTELAQLADKIREASPNNEKLVTLNDALTQLQKVQRNPTTGTIQRIAQEEGLDAGKLATIYQKYIRPNIVRQAGFEYRRELNLPEHFIENNPIQAYMHYTKDAAKRFAMAEHFGPEYDNLLKLRDQMLGEAQYTGHGNNLEAITRDVNNFIDGVVGRQTIDREIHAANNVVLKDIYRSKLGFIPAVANALQGINVATGFFGADKGIVGQAKAFLLGLGEDTLRSLPGGNNLIKDKRFVEDVGLMGMNFAKEDMEFAQKVWSRFTPFPLTEDINYRTVAIAAKSWMQEAFANMKTLREGSSEFQNYQERMKNLGVDAQSAIKRNADKLSDKELQIGAFNAIRKGMFPKLIGDFPEYFRDENNRSSYIFFHFMVQQPKYWQQTLKIGTPATLASSILLSAALGEIPADLSYKLQGKKRTDNLGLRAAENVIFSQPIGWIGYNVGQFGSSVLPSIGGALTRGIGAAGTAVYQAGKKQGTTMDKAGAVASSLLESYLRGDIPRISAGPVTIAPIPFGADIARIYHGIKKNK